MATVTAVIAPDGATWRGMLALMRGDFDRTVQECAMGVPVRGLRRWGHAIVPSASAALVFRVAHRLHAGGWRRLAAWVTLLNRLFRGVVLHPASVIGPGLYIPHTVGVTFCGTAGARLTIYPVGYVAPERFPGWLAAPRADWPVLGDDVRVGTYAAVIGGVRIGDAAVIGMQVVIRTDLGAGLSAVVRPNWRTRRQPDAAAPEPLRHVP
jgi:serine O-acetyltransferase